MRAVDGGLTVEIVIDDGGSAAAGDVVARVEGSLASILTAERTALNFVQRLAGIATITRAYVERAGGVTILDTRKTTPGLRALEKAAVRAGGGRNHRADLGEALLIKDNHLAAARSIADALEAASAIADGRDVEIECDTLEQVREALDAGAQRILLDNMDPGMLVKAVAMAEGRAWLEASGGITPDDVGRVAATGVDAISVGALTHSAPAVDLSLDVEVV